MLRIAFLFGFSTSNLLNTEKNFTLVEVSQKYYRGKINTTSVVVNSVVEGISNTREDNTQSVSIIIGNVTTTSNKSNTIDIRIKCC
jgi:hypothetical protein